jgi:hypothetical protein
MNRYLKISFLFVFILLAVASCTTWEDEPEPQDTRTRLVNKTWYLEGKDGEVWVYYKQDGSWESSSGDEGSWNLPDSRTIKIQAKQDLLQNWEEDILEISGSSLETRVRGVSFSKKYSTAP